MYHEIAGKVNAAELPKPGAKDKFSLRSYNDYGSCV